MVNIVNKEKCCGCTACDNICPVNAISMQRDDEGFLYPVIDKARCIECNKCEKICPINNAKLNSECLEAYAVQNKDEDILYHSASGGAFSAIARVVIERNGVVYGAAYEKNMVVKHIKVNNAKYIYKFRSSKYVQSQQDNIYQDVKKELLSGKLVCYSGTPCQVSGLLNYLGKNYSNLITVDVVCKGVGSPEVLRQYVEFMEKKYNSCIKSMNFKRKTYGYHSSTMSVDFENGVTYSKGGITDPMMRSFRANICLRPSCPKCQFKGVNRASDITIFDCWHYTELSKKKDDDRGHTAVLVHTIKGKNIILHDCNQYLLIDKIDATAVINYDGVMVNNSVNVHPNRSRFMNKLKEKGLMVAINEEIPVRFSEKIKDKSKMLLYKMGVLNSVKQIFSNRSIR